MDIRKVAAIVEAFTDHIRKFNELKDNTDEDSAKLDAVVLKMRKSGKFIKSNAVNAEYVLSLHLHDEKMLYKEYGGSPFDLDLFDIGKDENDRLLHQRPEPRSPETLSEPGKWKEWCGAIQICQKVYVPMVIKRQWSLSVLVMKLKKANVYDNFSICSTPSVDNYGYIEAHDHRRCVGKYDSSLKVMNKLLGEYVDGVDVFCAQVPESIRRLYIGSLILTSEVNKANAPRPEATPGNAPSSQAIGTLTVAAEDPGSQFLEAFGVAWRQHQPLFSTEWDFLKRKSPNDMLSKSFEYHILSSFGGFATNRLLNERLEYLEGEFHKLESQCKVVSEQRDSAQQENTRLKQETERVKEEAENTKKEAEKEKEEEAEKAKEVAENAKAKAEKDIEDQANEFKNKLAEILKEEEKQTKERLNKVCFRTVYKPWLWNRNMRTGFLVEGEEETLAKCWKTKMEEGAEFEEEGLNVEEERVQDQEEQVEDLSTSPSM
uniref:Uncharacterized protein n=1 Tax=Cannabis sativa TaxID=3483 RepID=A0A803P5L1_CANSA